MTAQANYAARAITATTAISTANTNRDGTGTLGVVYCAATTSGARLDSLIVKASGTTTAGMVRLFLREGCIGVPIASITFAAAVATVTTTKAHGLSTGNTIHIRDCLPREYNNAGLDATVTVLSATTFTYNMASTPTANCTDLGSYAVVGTSIKLLEEIPVTAITPSGTVKSFQESLLASTGAGHGIFPLILSPGWALLAGTHNAEGFNISVTFGGSFV